MRRLFIPRFKTGPPKLGNGELARFPRLCTRWFGSFSSERRAGLVQFQQWVQWVGYLDKKNSGKASSSDHCRNPADTRRVGDELYQYVGVLLLDPGVVADRLDSPQA